MGKIAVKISILTPSNRDIEGLQMIAFSLSKQDLDKDDYEWIVGSPEEPKDLYHNIDVWVQDPIKEEGDYWVLNKLYNRMINAASGELIVSIQDYTSFDPGALLKYWFNYQNTDGIISGVGNKYDTDDFVVKTWQDPRERSDLGSFYETTFDNIEGNFCAVPKKALELVGGFDNYLDKYAGMDWYSVLDRINMTGKYKFYLDQSNKSYSVEHGRYKDWDLRNAISGPYQKRREFYLKNGYNINCL